MSKERISLYFNTDVIIEKKMWDFICSAGKNRKSYIIKKAIELAMINDFNNVNDISISENKKEPINIIEASEDDISDMDIDEIIF